MMTEEAIQALVLRLAANKASIKKLPKLLELLSEDDRLRFQYSFIKAHTHRWAGRGVQLQNLKAARTKEEKAMIAAVIKMLETGRPVPDLDALSMAIRPLLTAPAGKKIVLADKKSIENRALAWAAGCEPMMAVYKTGKDPYIDFAARMEGCDYSDVTAEMRQQAKPATLGAGFGLGGGQLVRKCKCECKHLWNVKPEVTVATCPQCKKEVNPGMIQKTGLWKYAEAMGIDLSQEKAQAQVDAFRDTFYDVAQWWYYLEEAWKACVKSRRTQTITSSLGCTIKFVWKSPALHIVMPNGTSLVYPNAYAKEERTAFGSTRLILGYESERGHGWGPVHTYGGRICENAVQKIARDCLADDMQRVEEDPGLEIVGHTHDELICLADEADKTAEARLVHYMSVTPEWAPGLILGADGHSGKRYEKA